MAESNTHVVFIHLDLGIGGAESLVLNLAKATLPPNYPNHDDDGHDDGDGSSTAQPAADDANNSTTVEPNSNRKDNDPSSSISIYTTHCSPTHCYDEVRPPTGPLSPHVHIRGSWIPRHLQLIGGTALFSALRMLYLTYCAMRENPNANVFVLDVLPTGVPYLVHWWNVRAGVLFYCHFPDKLLTRDTVNGEDQDQSHQRASISSSSAGILMQLKRFYRWVLDTLEEWTMSFSDLIVVNSKFTMGEVEKVFPSLFLPRNDNAFTTNHAMGGTIQQEHYGDRVKVLYPAIESSLSKERKKCNNTKSETQKAPAEFSKERSTTATTMTRDTTTIHPIVSLNRFERKKNVNLLLHAYELLLERASKGELPSSCTTLPPLMIAGGYDPLNVENVEHLSELRGIADEILGRYSLPLSTVVSPSRGSSLDGSSLDNEFFTHNNGNNDSNNNNGNSTDSKHLLKNVSITFLPSVSNTQRNQLLSSASTLCYTPHREHFGIVPLEAMDAGVPVVAIRSGGPMETIVDGVTGFLVDYSPDKIENGDTATNDNDCGTTTASNTNKNVNATVKGYADAIAKIISNPEKSQLMGQNGRKRVDEIFGMDTFRKEWWELLRDAQKRGMDRYYANIVGRGYGVSSSLLRSLWDLLIVIFLAIVLTWVLRKAGLLVENKGVVGSIKVWLGGRDEL